MIVVVHSDKIFLHVIRLYHWARYQFIQCLCRQLKIKASLHVFCNRCQCVIFSGRETWRTGDRKTNLNLRLLRALVRRGEGDLSLTAPGCRPKEEQTVCHQLSPRICQDSSPTHNALLLLMPRRPRDGHTLKMLLTQNFWD